MSTPWRDLLPASLEVGGAEYPIRSDYRAALDICAALSDGQLTGQDKVLVLLDIFYPDLREMPPEDYQQALERCLWFLGGGGTAPTPEKQLRLLDWEQDFAYIVSPINRVLGKEVRGEEYLHWWTFLSAYMEIGDCLFAQIVRIRDKLAKGKPLDKSDKEFYRHNRHIVDLKKQYSQEDDAVLSKWLGK